jgi:hypothetical protein
MLLEYHDSGLFPGAIMSEQICLQFSIGLKRQTPIMK